MKNEQKCDPTCTHPLLTRLGIHSFDNVGMGVSGICIVHCLFTPVALVALHFLPLGDTPLGGTPLLEALHHWIHPVLALMIVPVTLLAMWVGFRQHRKLSILLPLVVGLVIVLTTSWFAHEGLYPVAETEFNFLGSGLLIIGHWWNRQTCK